MVKVRARQIQMQKNINVSPFNKSNHKTAFYKLWHIVLCLLLLLNTGTVIAEVTASTGRTVLSIDETLVLEIKSENNSGDPDLAGLEDDFQIMGRSQSQNFSMINGHASRTHSWNITLLPKKTGEITIPAIKIGSETTRPIHLVIKKQSNTPAIDGKEVFLKIVIAGNSIAMPEDSSAPDAAPSSASSDSLQQHKQFYVQQQIMVTVQLFHRIRFSNAALTDLELTNTVVEKLGNDANYSKTISNHRYNIIERHYSLYPQQSGELTIPAFTFSGNAEISQNFSLFSRPGRQIINRTKPITLNILPIPESYTGKNWLPAENLEIESEIIEDTHSITAGEAITRSIIVRAKGLLSSQLPVTSVASSNTIKAYPDKEKLSNQLINGQVVGIRHDTVAIIPLKAGRFTLPEIKIDWWNTKTNQQETTRLPAQSLLALPNNELTTNAQKSQSNTLSETKDSEVKASEEKNSVSQQQTTQAAQQVSKTNEKIVYKEISITKNIWFWISIVLFILWMITLALFFVAYSNNKKIAKKTSSDSLNNSNKNSSHNKHHNNYLQSVYDACLDNNAHKASQALIQWARYYFKQPTLSGLSAIIQLINDEQLSNAINNLESSQYSQDKQSWDGKALISALTHCVEQNKTHEQSKRKKPQAFSSLNP